jgi:hypothetical protein
VSEITEFFGRIIICGHHVIKVVCQRRLISMRSHMLKKKKKIMRMMPTNVADKAK